MVQGSRFLLLVGPLVLFVNHDEAQVLYRGEQGAAGANHHVESAAPYVPPLVEFLARRLLAMQQGDAAREPGVNPLQRLRGQSYFRHQEHGPPAHAGGVGHGPQVHLGLAAAGDAVEQEGAGGHRRRRAVPPSFPPR